MKYPNLEDFIKTHIKYKQHWNKQLYFLICIPLTIFGVMTGLLCSYFGRAFVAGYGSGPEIVNEMFTAVFRE